MYAVCLRYHPGKPWGPFATHAQAVAFRDEMRRWFPRDHYRISRWK